MYVCVCRAIKATQIREAVANGCDSLEALAEELGLGSGCGTCMEYARQMVEDQIAETTPYAAA